MDQFTGIEMTSLKPSFYGTESPSVYINYIHAIYIYIFRNIHGIFTYIYICVLHLKKRSLLT